MSVKIYTCGGSIDKAYSTKESAFVVAEPAVAEILGQANVTIAYDIEPLMQKDSLDMDDDDRALIAGRVRADEHRHVLITHGTDTLVETAKALSSVLAKTIVLTGAMQPAAFKTSDAAFNLGAAFLAAQLLPPGVYIAMNGQIFDPAQAAKNVELDRFEAAHGHGARG